MSFILDDTKRFSMQHLLAFRDPTQLALTAIRETSTIRGPFRCIRNHSSANFEKVSRQGAQTQNDRTTSGHLGQELTGETEVRLCSVTSVSSCSKKLLMTDVEPCAFALWRESCSFPLFTGEDEMLA
jgi:hypothetical protein